jgi:hypothetical protein
MHRYLRMKRLQGELEVRFQTHLLRGQQQQQGVGGQQQYRSGDLLDPRSRTKRHLDVTVLTMAGIGGVVVREQPPFVVLALRVEAVHHKEQSVSVSVSVSVAEGSVVWGYFRPETLCRLGEGVAVGLRLRVFDFVLFPGFEKKEKEREREREDDGNTADTSFSGDGRGGGGAHILLCTSLCEAL